MKLKGLALALTAGLTFAGCAAQDTDKVIELNTLNQKFSYSYGLNLGQNFKLQEMDVDFDVFLKGMKDGLDGVEPMLTPEEIAQVKADIQEEITAKAKARAEARAEKNKVDGAAYLEENGKKEGVITTESGLQYRVIEEGTGPQPKVSSSVTVDYVGKLIDGTVFDSSHKRGEPVTFPVGGVIPGWTEALQLMKEGAKYELAIPSVLAYGERGAGPLIEPNSVLLFEVELHKVSGGEATE